MGKLRVASQRNATDIHGDNNKAVSINVNIDNRRGGGGNLGGARAAEALLAAQPRGPPLFALPGASPSGGPPPGWMPPPPPQGPKGPTDAWLDPRPDPAPAPAPAPTQPYPPGGGGDAEPRQYGRDSASGDDPGSGSGGDGGGATGGQEGERVYGPGEYPDISSGHWRFQEDVDAQRDAAGNWRPSEHPLHRNAATTHYEPEAPLGGSPASGSGGGGSASGSGGAGGEGVTAGTLYREMGAQTEPTEEMRRVNEQLANMRELYDDLPGARRARQELAGLKRKRITVGSAHLDASAPARLHANRAERRLT